MKNLLHNIVICLALFTLLLLTSSNLFAFNNKKDSLRKAIDTASNPSIQVDILIQLVNAYMNVSTDTSIMYVDKSLHLSKSNHLLKDLGVTYRLKGVVNLYSGQLNEAITYFDSSLSIRRQLNDSSGEILVLNNIAYAYQQLGNVQQSKQLFFKALNLAIKNKFPLRQADIYNNLGLHYKGVDNHDSSLYYYQKSLEINELDENRLSEVALINNNIATIYFYKAEFLKAINGFQLAYDFAIESNNNRVKLLALSNIATIYTEVGLYDNAIKIYVQLLEMYEKAKHESNRLGTLYNLANAYYNGENYKRAIALFKSLENQLDSSQLRKNRHMETIVYKTFTYLALSYHQINQNDTAEDYFHKSSTFYEKMDRHTKGLFNNELASYSLDKSNLIQSENYLLRNLKIDRIDSFPDILLSTYSILLNIHKERGKENSSFAFKKELEKYKQIVSVNKKETETLRKSIEFDTERRELEIQLMNKENMHIKSEIAVIKERKRKQLYLLLLSMTLVIAVSIWWYISQKSKRALSKQEAARLKLSNENEKLISESLSRELELKQKELVSQALRLAQKNEAISKLKEKLMDEFRDNPSEGLKRSIQSIENQISIEKDWESFRISFESVYEDFFDKLKKGFPELTSRELQLCSLLRLNMSIKKMSSLLGISEEGVKKARYRIRKKLGLRDPSTSLSSFLMKY